MSDAASLPLPKPPFPGVERDYAGPIDELLEESEPFWVHTFSYDAMRRRSGLSMTLAALALVGVGIYLLTQIPATPRLTTQLVFIGLLLMSGGAWAAWAGLHDLLGTLTIDERGVHVQPNFGGFSVAWSDLRQWEVKDYAARSIGMPGLIFWRGNNEEPFTIRCGTFSEQAKDRIRLLLRSRVPRLERALETRDFAKR